MTIKRMDNVLIVVDDLEAVKAFFIELGLALEGETTVEGPSVANLLGLEDVRATLAMMRTPYGQGIELDKFHTPTRSGSSKPSDQKGEPLEIGVLRNQRNAMFAAGNREQRVIEQGRLLLELGPTVTPCKGGQDPTAPQTPRSTA